ncbi:XopAW family type III secretion system calcium-binding effector [Acidovorax sp. A1169]|uniref:XopAW family type III secretion system calcium-binding effector n=1 Tax=Acidovorax sp. A1169 TaxID=3059524 RepID=UPI002737B50D|nr:XopAW family type III secretion system calcium-binding effector [Acidovorax sp. A1169]MDP4073254.1 XopAW family type III secretion system calcium-binding effector [Acidovorax sp. A1169]
MTSINSVSSAWSSASVQRASRPGPSPERLLSKIDADGSGGVSGTELQGLLDDVAKKTGASSQTSAADLVQQYDSDGDGSLNADELGKTMQSVLPPPPSTMSFAQSRSDSSSTGATGQAGDDLFGKVDTDGDGAVGQAELQALLEKMSGGTASKTGVSSDELFSQLDADGDGSLSKAEFDAGRPSGEAGGGAVGGMPPPPPGGPGGPGGASASSSTYDPLDTNEDGVVSAAEQAAGAAQTDAITALFKTIDTDGDSSISSEEARSFVDQLASQLTSANSTTDAGSQTADSGQKTDLMKLAQFARSQYEAAAGSWSSTGSTLSALA